MNLGQIKTLFFLNNKYAGWYFDIIDKAKHRNNPSTKYLEKHHIVPDSFFKNRSRSGYRGVIDGNPNDPENLVFLTFREHYICHALLTRIVIHPNLRIKAVFALQMMQTRADDVVSSRLYEMGKKEASIAKSAIFHEVVKPGQDKFWDDPNRVKEANEKRRITLDSRTYEQKKARTELGRFTAAKNFFTEPAKRNRESNLNELNSREDQSWKWPESRRERYKNGKVTRFKNEREWFLSPEGDKILMAGITLYAAQNNLDCTQLRNLIRKPHKHKSYKGWTYIGPDLTADKGGKK